MFWQCGFEIIFKPTIPIKVDGKRTLKGNVDAELVLHTAAIEYDHYRQAVIITSDGDFACLLEYLVKNNKLRRLITTTTVYSSLLRKYTPWLTTLVSIRHYVQKNRGAFGGRRNGST